MNMVKDSVDTLARRRDLLGTPYRLFYSEPVELVRGDGTWVFDAEGERYLDAYNNVPCVGHSHPRVVQALSRQASLLNTHTRYLSKVTLEYAERLLDTLPAELGHVMFTCSGSEANDLALQLARRWTGNAGVIVTSHAYHGTTTATAALSPSLDPTMVAIDQVELVQAPPSSTGSSEDVDAFGRRVAAAVDALVARGVHPAALIVDSVLSSDGLVPAPAGFLAGAAAAVRAAGGLYISDEVQAGFGRTGHMWGFERHGVVPDIVTMGKPMGNGYPLAGLAARADIVDAFGRERRYFNTFAGTPVACAAGLAVLDVLAEERLVERAGVVGSQLLADVGGPYALAPVHGTLRSGGRVVGHFTTAIQDDAGYLKLARLFTGADVLMRAGARQVMGTLSPGPASVPDRGVVSYGGRSYQAYSFTGEAFPSGPLRISLLY